MAEAAVVPALLTPATVAAVKAPLAAFPGNPPSGGWTQQVPCRYFMHGVCKEGHNCRYSHDLSTSRTTMICRYYQRGCCAYGDYCRFEHTKPLKQELTGDVSSAKIYLPESITETSCKSAELAVCDLPSSKSEDWANAVEFVPGQLYYGRGNILGQGTF